MAGGKGSLMPKDDSPQHSEVLQRGRSRRLRAIAGGRAMNALSCGLWPTPRGLVAAAVDLDAALVVCARLPEEEDEQLLWLSRLEH